MLHSLCRLGLAAALLGWFFVPEAAWGQKEARPRHVHDEAKLFSKDAIDQANRTIEKIKKSHGKDLFIESVESGEKDKELRTKWAKARFNDFGIDGIYIVVSKEPSFYRFYVGDNTREKGYFSKANIDKMDESLKQITKAGKRDDALIEAANYVLEAMNEHARSKPKEITPKKAAAPAVQVAQQPVIHHNAAAVDNALPDWVGWVCMIVAFLVVIWVIFAIIRAVTGMMMGGGGGYGGGGYGGGGYGYGGGGGGFLTGMLGGLFGSMAGMWMYNNFFGGHASYGQNGAVNWGGGDQGATGAAAADPYEADTAGGGTGGGGDDDAGTGGDAGGGGADAGGGGDGDDAGGGGDDAGGGGGGWFGGGGGDAGGGDAGGGGGWFGGGGDAGGGDWGEGGGGDFGGGGGGGGDW